MARAVKPMVRLRPSMIVSRMPSLYTKHIHVNGGGTAEFDQEWKTPAGVPTTAQWVDAVTGAWKRIDGGLDIAVPVLVARSASTGPERDDNPRFYQQDVVVDTAETARLTPKLGPRAEELVVEDGMHDLTVSAPGPRAQYYAGVAAFLDKVLGVSFATRISTPAARSPRSRIAGFNLDGLENSMAAFAAAVDLGYHYVETDAHGTSDGIAVALHDASLDRTTDAHGNVATCRGTRSNTRRSAAWSPCRCSRTCSRTWPELRVNVDVKADSGIAPIAAAIERTKSHDRVCVASFSAARRSRNGQAALSPGRDLGGHHARRPAFGLRADVRRGDTETH